jgi:hypothetical protein
MQKYSQGNRFRLLHRAESMQAKCVSCCSSLTLVCTCMPGVHHVTLQQSCAALEQHNTAIMSCCAVLYCAVQRMHVSPRSETVQCVWVCCAAG